MDIVWSRLLKSAYRKEPVISFVITVGIVDAAIGGLSEHWSLLAFGLGTVSAAVILRWRQLQRQQAVELVDRAPIHILPPRSSRPSLPMLSVAKKNPPRQR